MAKIVVLSTGGTIASRPDQRGAGVASDGVRALLDRLRGDDLDPGIEVEGVDVFRVGSFLLAPRDMAEIVRRARRALADPGVRGVVVTHGTDSMEETAFLADLVHDDPRPMVFTGAQRHAAAPDTDGPRNLADAIAVAASPAATGLGALIVFDGRIYPARGTRKSQTLAGEAFAAPDTGPLGRVRDGAVHVTSRPVRPAALGPGALDLAGVRVDVVACYPGADAVALGAVVAAGARGVVLEAMGAGNANHALCDEIARLTDSGVLVALSTRVHSGPVAALYGNGGGVELVAAGAVPTGTLRPSQARMLLLALLATESDAGRVAAEVRRMALSEPATQAPSEPATENPTESAPKRPSEPAPKRPSEPAAQQPPQPAAAQPSEPPSSPPSPPPSLTERNAP